MYVNSWTKGPTHWHGDLEQDQQEAWVGCRFMLQTEGRVCDAPALAERSKEMLLEAASPRKDLRSITSSKSYGLNCYLTS